MELVAYRWADYDTPLWANRNRGPGRWHHQGQDPTQYWVLHPLGPWAEYLRAQGIRDQGDLDEIASRTWAGCFTFDVSEVAEVSFETAGEWQLTAEQLVGDDHEPCQALGGRLRAQFKAAVVPSAALPGTDNLIVFGARVLAPYSVPLPDPDLDVAAAMTADHGRPPPSLLELVCFRGESHAGLIAWQRGEVLSAPSLSYNWDTF